jgi:uncharacterized protein YjiS (DUF1127 family)
MSMSTTTLRAGGMAAPAGKERLGFFSRLLARLIKAREAQAKRYVDGYLAGLPDRQLADLGYTRKEIDELRKRAAGMPPAYFI